MCRRCAFLLVVELTIEQWVGVVVVVAVGLAIAFDGESQYATQSALNMKVSVP